MRERMEKIDAEGRRLHAYTLLNDMRQDLVSLEHGRKTARDALGYGSKACTACGHDKHTGVCMKDVTPCKCIGTSDQDLF